MFSLTTQKKKISSHIIEIILIITIGVAFLLSSTLYAFKNSIVFPITNLCLLILCFFIYNGKYRLYALFFSMPFIIFFNYKPLGIGSFYSYSIILYCILIFIELLIDKNRRIDNISSVKRVIIVLILAVYSIFITLINSGLNSVIRTISIFAYIGSISFFFFDKKAKKELSTLILLISFSLLIANVLACIILFFIKGDVAVQFLERFMNKAYVIHYKANNSSFRYPGLASDPNYLGFYTLLLTSVVVISFKRLKFKIPIVIITLLLQVFPLVGESKNYFLVIVLLAIVVSLYLLKIKNGVFISIGVLGISLIVLLVFGNSLLLPVLLRLINIDTRDGFLNAITTGRTSIQIMYFNEYLTNPVSFLFGKGFNSLLNNASAHNVYVMTFWYFGIFGTFLFYYWIFTFLPLSKIKSGKILMFPLFIMAIYALSLDYVSYSEMFLFILFLCYLSITNYQSYSNTQSSNNRSHLYHEITI